jgi:hypothetical protein
VNQIRVTIWNEFRHEREEERYRAVYPNGIHGAIAEGLGASVDLNVRAATLDEPENGLPEDVLMETDVLIWWGHKAHEEVSDETVNRVQARVLHGMGLVVLHSGHHSSSSESGLSPHRIRLPPGLIASSSSSAKRCMGSSLTYRLRKSSCSCRGSREERSFDQAVVTRADPERSSTSAPVMRAIRPSTTRMCGESSAMPSAGPLRSTDLTGFLATRRLCRGNGLHHSARSHHLRSRVDSNKPF